MARQTIWSPEEDEMIRKGMNTKTTSETSLDVYKRISKCLGGKSFTQFIGRWYFIRTNNSKQKETVSAIPYEASTVIPPAEEKSIRISSLELSSMSIETLKELSLAKLGVETSKESLIRFLLG